MLFNWSSRRRVLCCMKGNEKVGGRAWSRAFMWETSYLLLIDSSNHVEHLLDMLLLGFRNACLRNSARKKEVPRVAVPPCHWIGCRVKKGLGQKDLRFGKRARWSCAPAFYLLTYQPCEHDQGRFFFLFCFKRFFAHLNKRSGGLHWIWWPVLGDSAVAFGGPRCHKRPVMATAREVPSGPVAYANGLVKWTSLGWNITFWWLRFQERWCSKRWCSNRK